MRAITVCVDYSDIAAITIPYNRHHFDEFYVVTSTKDYKTQKLCDRLRVNVVVTDLFYSDGAVFNKWRSLEYGLDCMERKGWTCLMDADVLWPQDAQLHSLEVGKLYAPLRHMFEDITKPIPKEENWREFPIHRNVNEWAGYSQIFHADDPVLGPKPWHDITFNNAGAADSMFQFKWKPENKIRTPFNVLHLGPAGVNWFGRSSAYLDGTIPENAQERYQAIRQIWADRRAETGPDKFKAERIHIS